MVRNNKTTSAKLLSLLLTATLCFTVFTVPVSAEGSDGSPKQKDEKTKLTFLEDVDPNEPEPSEPVVPIYENGRWTRVHSLPATFEKNFILSPELKEYSIKKYKAVVSAVLEPEMSDLEKYYTLAIWLNRHVDYDWDFWPGGYDFDYYSHQWDAYGILKERKSVCAGIAVAYANLCHAADLPCKFIRMKPLSLDHTINYIPNINGHAYYIDVTENFFFMSEKANPWDPMDPEFSEIPDSAIPNDGSFEYSQGNNSYLPSEIKAYYDVPFEKWYTEYALHKNTKKKFQTKYEELGSGKAGVHYASYQDFDKYPAQPYAEHRTSGVTGIWFLDDFYLNPSDAKAAIEGKKFDEQFLNVSGIPGSYYGCTTEDELEAAVNADIENGDIVVKYFPSLDNRGNVVAQADKLVKGEDYTISCTGFDLTKGEAEITIRGSADPEQGSADPEGYNGSYQIPVKINSAFAEKVPANHMYLDYTGNSQKLVEPGTAVNGTILYAMHKKGNNDDAWKKGDPGATPYPEPADLQYSENIPTATAAGKYDIWYKIVGNQIEGDPAEGNYFDVPPQHVERVAVINRLQPKIVAKSITTSVGKKIKLAPTLSPKKAATYWYMSYNERIVKVSNNGTVSGVAVGTTKIVISSAISDEDPNYTDPDDIEITVKVTKGTNPLKLKARTATVKRSKLKKKAQTITRAKLITVSKAQGKLTYKLVSVKKGKKSFKKYFKVNAKTGKITVKKGLKKGTYKVKIKVKAAGNRNYNPSSWKYVTSTVRVKK